MVAVRFTYKHKVKYTKGKEIDCYTKSLKHGGKI